MSANKTTQDREQPSKGALRAVKRLCAPTALDENIVRQKGLKYPTNRTVFPLPPGEDEGALMIKWPKVKIKEYEDTAKAAADLASGKLPASTAVIASRAAASVYKLDILEESIQDLKFNYTSFIAAVAPKV